MYKRILLTVDGSENALRAAEHAIELAKLSNAKVDLINVIDFEEARNEMIQTTESELTEVRRQRYQPTVDLLTKNEVNHEVLIFYGNPGLSIVEHANKHDYDIVLVGSRGLNSFQEMFLGSVSHKVVQRVNCPVMIIK